MLNISVLGENESTLKEIIGNLEDSNTSPIFLVYNNVVKLIYYDPTINALGTDVGGSVLQFSSSSLVLNDAGDNLSKHAIFIKENEDKISKYELLEDQVKNNIISAENQNSALQYIYIFLLLISILSLMYNFDKIKLSHIAFLIFFIGYGFFYKYISMFIVIQFKDVMNSLKYTDSTTQLLSYLKLVLIATVSFLVPLLSLILFNTTYDVPLSDATDYTKSVIDNAVDYSSGIIETSRDTLNDGVSSISDGVDSVKNNVTDAVGTVSNTVGNIGETVSSSVNTISDQVSDGLNKNNTCSPANTNIINNSSATIIIKAQWF